MKKLILNTYESLKWLFGYRKKAEPLSNECLEVNEPKLRKEYFTDTPKGQIKIMRSIEPKERNTSSLKRRKFSTEIKNTIKWHEQITKQ